MKNVEKAKDVLNSLLSALQTEAEKELINSERVSALAESIVALTALISKPW